MNVNEFAELAAGYALHALSPEDARLYEEALAEHPEWASIGDADAAMVAELADGVSEMAPPPHIRDALLERIGPAGEPPLPTEVIQTVARRRWTRGLLGLAASFILLIAIGTGVAMLGDRLRQPESVTALGEIQGAPDARTTSASLSTGGEATLHWSDSVGKAVLVAEGAPTLDSDETYELWFVRDGAAASAGVFTTDDEGTATALLDGPVEPGDTIAITVEPEGGSPTGQPTSDPVLQLPTS